MRPLPARRCSCGAADGGVSRVVRRAFVRSLPVMAGYVVLGAGFGILLREAGYGPAWAFSMSLFIYAGSLQYVGVGLIAGGASLLTVFFTSLAVNARHLFYGITMAGRYRGAGRLKPYLVFSLTDETYSLLLEDPPVREDLAHLYRFFVSLFDHLYWIFGSVAGSLVYSVLPFSTAGIEFSMTALFVASFTEQWIAGRDRLSAVAGVLCTVLCLALFGPGDFLIPSMLLISLVLSAAVLFRKEVRR